jgi:hypothetical protein
MSSDTFVLVRNGKFIELFSDLSSNGHKPGDVFGRWLVIKSFDDCQSKHLTAMVNLIGYEEVQSLFRAQVPELVSS